MRKSVEGSTLREIRAIFVSGTQIGLSDGELLMRFVDREGEAAQSAFAALMQRHGPMVFRVCRRLLVDPHDSQDAFQATFLILVHKAGSLKDRDSVGPWLFGVACRVAAKSRSCSARRARHERRYAERPEPRESSEDPDRADLQMLIHEEIGRLPERYRIPVVLCYLGGVNQEDAAEQLGWPIGTVRSRLARARERLRGRLTRRGIALSTGALLGTLASNASAAPPALVHATVRAAMGFAAIRASTAGVVPASVDALMREVSRSFFMTRLKIATAVLATLGGTVTGAGVLAFEPGATKGVEPQEKERPKAEGRGADELEEHRAKEKAAIELLERRAKEREAREKEAKVKEAIELLEHRAKEEAKVKEAIELLEHRAKEKEAVELLEHRAKEKAAIERLQRAAEKASKERLIKAILAAGPSERLLRILEGEDMEEHRAKERALEAEARAKEKALKERRAGERPAEERERDPR